jgi:hypothetical protein
MSTNSPIKTQKANAFEIEEEESSPFQLKDNYSM